MLLNVNGDMLEREVAAPWGPMAYAGVRGIKERFIFLSLIKAWIWAPIKLSAGIGALGLRFGLQH